MAAPTQFQLLSLFFFHRYYWMKCTEPNTAESLFSRWEVWGAKAQSYLHCAVWNVFLPKQQIQPLLHKTRLFFQHSTSFKHSCFHTHWESSWASQLPFPAHVTEQFHDQLCHGSAALIPRCPGWTRCGQNSPTVPFQRCAWLKSCSAFSRACRNKQNKSSQHTLWQN